MTTLFVLDYLTFDATHSTEKEFEDKASVYAWLLGQRESDFHCITLFHGDNEPVDGWSDVIEFCRPIKPLTDLSVCGDACNCMKCNPAKTKPVRDIPKYMFAERPVTSSTWLELTSAQLDTYMLSDGTALLVDPQNREYCYVFWDEGEQCSNPYPNHAEAVMARTVYIANL